MKQVKNMENTKQFEAMETKDSGGSGVNALTSLAEVTIPTQAAVEMRVVTTTLGKLKVTEMPFTRFNVSITVKGIDGMKEKNIGRRIELAKMV
jgi:hypothetical protein